MQTPATETNVPLLVATVFAATFVVVGAIAYLIFFRRWPQDPAPPAPSSSAGPLPVEVADDIADTTQITLPLEDLRSAPPPPPVRSPAEFVPSGSAGPDPPRGASPPMFVTLYRALMFATGLAGLIASALMFSAVDGLSILPFVAFGIAAFSVYSIYRGFVPDPELRRPPRR